jgi:hypothetical protein
MKSKKISEHGQALVIIALAAVVLFGFVALAIDGSAKFSDRRHAQNAADTAALAGALALVNDQTSLVNGVPVWKLDALDRAKDNGYANDLVKDQVWVYECNDPNRSSAPLDCGPYEGDANHILVVILSHVDTTFARVFGYEQFDNLVNTVTFVQKRGPAFPGNSLVALKPGGSGCPGEFIVGGSGTVTLDGGGLFVNSNNPGGGSCGAFTQNGCQISLEVINGGGIESVGEIALEGSCSEQIDSPSFTEGADPLAFPPDVVVNPPPECDDAGYYPAQNDTVNNISYLQPGKYETIPPPDATENKIILAPGNYCVYDIVRVTNSTRLMQGSDVFFYIKYSSKPSPLSIQGGAMVLDAPNDGDYQGYLIYVEPPPIVNGTYAGSSKNCTINGGADDYFTGSIYAPYCDFTINGGGNPNGFHAQLIAYTITLSGNNDLYFSYDPDDSAINHPLVGLMR